MSLWNRPTRVVCAACKGPFHFFSGEWRKEGDRYRCPAVCPHCDRVFDLFCGPEELLRPGDHVYDNSGNGTEVTNPSPWWEKTLRRIRRGFGGS